MGELNQHNLNDYISKYNLKVFVETGTGKGAGLIYAARASFDKLYSIEIIPQLFDYNRQIFGHIEKIKIFNMSSIDGLNEILINHINNDTPILFWLDAHFPGADFHFNDYDHLSSSPEHMPLKAEIELIAKLRPSNKDVIIIDDLRIYEPNANYELGKWELQEKYGKGNIDFIVSAFGNTHTFKRDLRHQGFLILEPK